MSCASGTVRAAPSVAPVNMTEVHRPVDAPMASGTCSRTMLGTRPEARAMPVPARTTDTGSTPGTVAHHRMPAAIASTASASHTVCVRPKRAAIVGTIRATRPMKMTGTVVSRPIETSLHPVADWISTVTAGMLVSSVRRFTATRASAVSTTQRGDRDVVMSRPGCARPCRAPRWCRRRDRPRGTPGSRGWPGAGR